MPVLELTQRELDILAAGMSWFYVQGSDFLPDLGGFLVLGEIDDLADKVCFFAGLNRQDESDVSFVRKLS